VTINGANYAASNHGNGNWSLPAGTFPALPDGTYRFDVKAIDLANNQSIFTGTPLWLRIR